MAVDRNGAFNTTRSAAGVRAVLYRRGLFSVCKSGSFGKLFCHVAGKPKSVRFCLMKKGKNPHKHHPGARRLRLMCCEGVDLDAC